MSMKLTRRTVVATALASPLILRTAAAANDLRARIKVNTENTRGAIDRKLYGNFVEHLGRCIDGGMFQEGSPLSNAAGYRRDVLRSRARARREPAALAGRQLLLELPLDGRHRPARRPAAAPRDGVGHRREQPLRHARVPRLRRAAEDRAVHLRESRHRHVDGSAAVGGVLQLRRGHGHHAHAPQERPQGAVEGDVLGPRQRDGRPVADGPPLGRGLRQVRARGREAHALDRPEREADRRRLVELRRGRRLVAWNRTVVEQLQNYIDYLAIHLYVGNPNDDFGEFLASSRLMDDKIETTAKVIDGALAGRTDGKKVHIAFDEYNVWYRARGDKAARPPHSRGALQPRGCARRRHVPELAREPRGRGQDREHGAARERDRADLHERRGAVPADDLLPAAAVREEREGQFAEARRRRAGLQDEAARATCRISTCRARSTATRCC